MHKEWTGYPIKYTVMKEFIYRLVMLFFYAPKALENYHKGFHKQYCNATHGSDMIPVFHSYPLLHFSPCFFSYCVCIGSCLHLSVTLADKRE